MKSLKAIDIYSSENLSLLVLSVVLSIPAILIGENLLFALPVVIVIMLSFIFGERFIIAIIIISLFTLVGDLNRLLRTIVQLVDFTLLGILFLKRFGLNFSSYPKIPKSVIYFLLLYFSAMVISAVMSRYPYAGIELYIRQIVFFVVVYVFYALIASKREIKLYFSAIYLVGCILVTFSLLAFFSGGVSLLEIVSPNRPRVSAIITNIEASTNFFVVSFPLIISILLLKGKFSEKRIEYFLLIYFSLGLVLTMSRSAIIGIIISTAIIFYLIRRKRFYQLLFSITLVVFIFLFYEPLNEFLNTFLRIESGMSARDYVWKMSMDMINDHSLFGIGPGAYRYEMLNYFPYMLENWWGKLFIYYNEVTGGANLSHNFFLTFFTEMGILGILTAVALPIIYFRIGIKTITKFKNRSSDNYYLIIALFAAGSSIIVRNLFNGIGLLYVGGIQTDLPFWLIFVSLIYFYRMPLTTSEIPEDQIKTMIH
ncbi:MAG: O-antigen ligase family protein [Ignavibacteriaceae bacterium]|nr:O-antigen ligase family protein [Ignavibacteriaceae bacterium]